MTISFFLCAGTNVQWHRSYKHLWSNNITESLGTFSCSQCGKIYQYKRSLWRHRRYECGKLPMFSCPYCTQKFALNSNMLKHIKRRHLQQFDMGHDLPNLL